MAQLTLSTLLTEVQDYIPGKPIAQVSRAANQVLRRLYRELNLTHRSTFTTTAPYSTGTVSVTQGQTAVTSSGATWTNGITCLLKIAGCDTWFTFTTTSTSAGTLSSAWPETSVSGGTYEMVFPFVTFPAAVLYPTRLYLQGYTELRFASDENRGWYTNDPAQPMFFIPMQTDTSATPDDAYRIQLLPSPDDAYAVNYIYKVRPTYFTATAGDKSYLPAMFDDAILYGTLFHCWDQEDKQDRSTYWKAMYEQAMAEARAEWSALQVTRMGGDGLGGTYEDWPVTWSDPSTH